MLKRYQILLNSWLADFAKVVAEGHDMSFSEIVRLTMCVTLGTMISKIVPDYKFKFTTDDLYDFVCRVSEQEDASEETHRFMSELYFETRKAIEHVEKLIEKRDPSVEVILKLLDRQEGEEDS